ncbi:unnamed protein product [Tetraodon nigroviridis]|uniref:(spotted green pufferfish) hypothetical protein n=1 Tax=Tetraodon nigroviridis TaxID=99883 RepID=Q4TGM3_TETNG|nr:unnamed protein product [Tetraodon nigroviridis]
MAAMQESTKPSCWACCLLIHSATHVHMQHLNCQEPWRRSWETGETRGEDRQAGSRRGPRLSATLDRGCACVGASVRQLPSACRATGVYSSSLSLPGPLHPLSPRGLPTGQRHAPNFCFSFKN